MRRWTIRSAVGSAVVATLLAGPAAAQVPGPSPGEPQPGGDSTAVAINTKDGSSIFKLAFKIHRVMSDTVSNQNAAVAYASCTECQTVAVAIQVVLVFSDPSIVTPQNLAIAVNQECTSCQTMAAAYQWVFSTGGPVHFTAEGNQTLAEIRRALLELGQQDLTLAELQAALDEIVAQLEEVLATQLVPAGHAGEEPGALDGSEDPGESTSSPTSSPDPTPTLTASPTPTPTPTASPTPTSTESVTTSPTPTSP